MKLMCQAQLPPRKSLDLGDFGTKMELSVHDSEDAKVQDLRSRTQLLFGKSPEYFHLKGEEDSFREQGMLEVRVVGGTFSAVGKARRRAIAIKDASSQLLERFTDMTPNFTEILENIGMPAIDQFIVNQKYLLELEVAASTGFRKEEQKKAGEEDKLEVTDTIKPVYGGTVVTLWSTGTAPVDVRAGGNVVLRGHEAKLFGIVVLVDEAQVMLSVRENQLVFSMERQFQLERLDGSREFDKLKAAVENSKNPKKYYTALRDVLFGMKEPSVAPPMAEPINFQNASLDKRQKETVMFVLRQEELAIIHGPPGTGKTTTVVEVILQSLRRGTRVLVCAPSNIAVDNILERLVNNLPDNRGALLRIGQPARVTPALQEFTLDALVEDKMAVVEELKSRVALVQEKLDQGSDGMTKERDDDRRALEGLKQEVRGASQVLEGSIKEAMEQANVVLGTLSSCTPDGPLQHLAEEHFGLTVVDEAGQALEAACWMVVPCAPRLLLAGDHLQLPPTIHSKNKDVRKRRGETMMERMINRYGIWGGKVAKSLNIQYRMNKAIMQWSSDHFYFKSLYAAPGVADHCLAQLPGVQNMAGLTDSALFLIDTAMANMPESSPGDSCSFANVGEARIACNIVGQLLACGVKPEQVGVITTYAKQVELLERNLGNLTGLEIKTVDGFQGREKEVIVLSLVRSNKASQLGFLVEERRLNVAVTRARRKLVVICDSSTVARDPTIASLLEYLRQEGSVAGPEHLPEVLGFRVPDSFKAKPKSESKTSG